MSRTGRKTSEFWITLGTGVIVLLNNAFNLGIDVREEVVLGALTTVYTFGRSLVKTFKGG
jgi:hypothetical protein